MDVAYAYYSTLDGACESCAKSDGLHVLTSQRQYKTAVPNLHCTHRAGCRCIWVYVSEDEPFALEIRDFLAKQGGTAPDEEVDAHRKKVEEAHRRADSRR